MVRTASLEPLERLRGLLVEQKLAVLATSEAGRPYTSLVAFAATPDLGALLLATERATRKYANLAAEPRVALLIDSRTHQDSDLHEALAVTALGRAETVEGPEQEALRALLLVRHPQLAGFVRSPTCALVRVRVQSYILVSSFQEVITISMGADPPPITLSGAI